MPERRIESFAEFWPFYVREHSLPACRALHFVGSTLVLIVVAAAAYYNWWLLLLAPVVGYGFAWVGHFAIEKNKPASFKYPLWSFVPLALLMRLGPVTDPVRLRRFAIGLLAILVIAPVAYAAVEVGEPLLRDRPKATQFPGRMLADIVTRTWRERFDTPLVYVGGGEFATNNVAVYSADRPHVIVHGSVAAALWIRQGVLTFDDAVAQALLTIEGNARDVDTTRTLFGWT